MNKTTRKFGIALTAAAGLACAVPAAFAAGTFTVTAGSAPPGTLVPFHAITTGPTPQVHFTDTTSNVNLTCDSGTATGTIGTGAGLSGADALTINGSSTTWTNCQGAGFTFTLTGSGNWQFNAASGSSTGASGTLTGVSISATGTGSFGATCNLTISGSVAATFTDSSPNPTLGLNGGGQTISGVGGTCGSLGVIKNGDAATLQLPYLIIPDDSAYSPIAITQP